MKLHTLLLTLLLSAFVPVLYAQEPDTKSGHLPLTSHLIPGYHNYRVDFSQRAKQIAFLQSNNVLTTGKSIPASVKRKNNPNIYLADGTLNYQYLNGFINYGEGPSN